MREIGEQDYKGFHITGCRMPGFGNRYDYRLEVDQDGERQFAVVCRVTRNKVVDVSREKRVPQADALTEFLQDCMACVAGILDTGTYTLGGNTMLTYTSCGTWAEETVEEEGGR